jgi:pimeloyl-ACP methyl ester carboxylesterase
VIVAAATREQTRARYPDETGYVERDGVSLYYEVYGSGEPTVFLLPTWQLLHSRQWKMQIPFLARSFRVLTFDGRGSGRSDKPTFAEPYAYDEEVADAIAVMDATRTERAVLVGFSHSGALAILQAAGHPERTLGAAVIGPAIAVGEGPPTRVRYDFDEVLDTDVGWAKYNRHYWLRDYPGFVEFFIGEMFPEPHSTKAIDDMVGWGLENTPETLLLTNQGARIPRRDPAPAAEICRRVRCPVLVIHGDIDQQVGVRHGVAVAQLTGGELVTFEGSGHAPHVRDPVVVNTLLRDFVRRCA